MAKASAKRCALAPVADLHRKLWGPVFLCNVHLMPGVLDYAVMYMSRGSRRHAQLRHACRLIMLPVNGCFDELQAALAANGAPQAVQQRQVDGRWVCDVWPKGCVVTWM